MAATGWCPTARLNGEMESDKSRQVIVNTDNAIVGSEKLGAWVEGEVERALASFNSSITRVEIHLKAERAAVSGSTETSCVIEARVAGLDPLIASEFASDTGGAVTGAAAKLNRVLESALGRLRDQQR